MSKGKFTPQELNAYRLQLQTLLEPLETKVADLQAEALHPATVPTNPDRAPAHDADPGTRDTEDRVAMAVLNTEAQIMGEVTSAIARLDAGKFGICEKCGHSITKTRLDVVPYARHCIQCARAAEAKG